MATRDVIGVSRERGRRYSVGSSSESEPTRGAYAEISRGYEIPTETQLAALTPTIIKSGEVKRTNVTAGEVSVAGKADTNQNNIRNVKTKKNFKTGKRVSGERADWVMLGKVDCSVETRMSLVPVHPRTGKISDSEAHHRYNSLSGTSPGASEEGVDSFGASYGQNQATDEANSASLGLSPGEIAEIKRPAELREGEAEMWQRSPKGTGDRGRAIARPDAELPAEQENAENIEAISLISNRRCTTHPSGSFIHYSNKRGVNSVSRTIVISISVLLLTASTSGCMAYLRWGIF